MSEGRFFHKLSRVIPLVLVVLSLQSEGQSLSGVKIYVNPGHGGFDSDDRNVPVPPYVLGDTAGFWESKSNLVKGLHLRTLLQAEGAAVIMSRVQNRTVDDRPLSAIAEEANANQSDFMISIHSNAFNSATNYVLMLYHGWDGNPLLPQSLQLANLFWDNLFSNQTSHWTSQSRNVRGDKSFAPESWNGYGVLRPLTVPGLISEGSFHDYTPETYRLLNREYKQLEAWHFFRAFCQFYGGSPGTQGKIAGTVKDSYRKVSAYPVPANSKEQWLPVNGARVTLQPGDRHYTTDPLNNGFYLFDNLERGLYSLTFEADKYVKQVVDTLRVDSARVTYYLCRLDQDRSDPLKVEDYGPKPGTGGVVAASSDVVFHFNFEIDTATFREAFLLEPAAEGTFVYDNQGRTARFVHSSPFDVSTLYTVTLRKTARHIGNLPMEEDFVFSFTTAARNRLMLVDSYPRNGMETVYPTTQVRLHLDGRLVNDALASRIEITDLRGNPVNRTGVELNTFSGPVGSYAFLLTGLIPDSSYILKVKADLRDEEGLKLMEDKEIRFKVRPVFQSALPVAFDFEASATTWGVDTLRSLNIIPGTANRILRYSGAKLFGGYCWRLLYSFNNPEASVMVRPPEPLFMVRDGQYAGIYLWGDLSHNRLSLLFDQNGQKIRVPFTTIDFAGWQFREVQLSLPGQTTGFTFDGFFVESAGTPFSGSGVIYLDNLIVSEHSITRSDLRLSEKLNSLLLFPNPAGDFLSVTLPGKEGSWLYEIVTVQGKIIRSGKAVFAQGRGVIPLAGVGAGTYILGIRMEQNIERALFVKQ